MDLIHFYSQFWPDKTLYITRLNPKALNSLIQGIWTYDMLFKSFPIKLKVDSLLDSSSLEHLCNTEQSKLESRLISTGFE